MTRKLLLLTAGTVAAGVGREFLKQIKEHPASELSLVVRYIDTANLLTRYNGLRSGEWFQMTINPQYMHTIQRNLQNYPSISKLLYPGFYPEIQGSGSGSIRYNAAGALVINRSRMKEWLTTSIIDLVRSDGVPNLSIALIVSAVGATGSGTLEHLLDLVVDCAQTANVPSPVHCDVFILQPGMQGVTDLGLANTFALYGEMAATRLSGNGFPRYHGRTIMVGWVNEESMNSLDQLKETAATLVRLTQDPSTSLAIEFQERLVDNHVLSDIDWQTSLPSHLSTATAVTISLGDLEEKIIQRDSARLVADLTFNIAKDRSFAEDLFISPRRILNDQPDSLFGTLASLLKGDTVEECYEYLIGHLQEGIYLKSLRVNPFQMQNLPTREQARALRNMWQLDIIELKKLSQPKIKDKGATLVVNVIEDMKRARRDYMSKGFSLLRLLNEYQQLQVLLASILKIAEEYTQPAFIDEKRVYQELDTLDRAWCFKGRALQRAIATVQANLSNFALQSANVVAIEIVKTLERYCFASLHNLEIISETSHSMHLPVLSTQDEIIRYINQVSIFPNQATEVRRHLFSSENDDEKGDQFKFFRAWLEAEDQVNALIGGDNDLLLDLAQNYVRQRVHKEVEKHSVIDVLLQTGEKALIQRLSEAAEKSHSLVDFSDSFASERREARFVCAYFEDEVQRNYLLKAIKVVFGSGYCQLIHSKDPTEIVIFYYVDGLSMAAITDLTGRCLNAFLKRRHSWYKQLQTSSYDRDIEVNDASMHRIGVPVYSSKDAEERVIKTGVVQQLYEFRGQGVESYTPEDLPELYGGSQSQAN